MAIKTFSQRDMTGQRILNLGPSSAGTDAVNRNELDAAVRGFDWKASVRAASTGNLTVAAPGATIDGVSMSAGDRVLFKDQTTQSQNGLYVWNGAATPATRTTDADADVEVTNGLAVTVAEGTANGNKSFVLTTDDPIVVGTTSLVFSQLGGGGTTYTAGNGLSLSGDAFSVTADTGISVTGSGVAVNTALVVRKVVALIGNGSSTALSVTHNLGTRAITFSVREVATHAFVECEVDTATSVNVATFTFATAPASNAYEVTIHG